MMKTISIDSNLGVSENLMEHFHVLESMPRIPKTRNCTNLLNLVYVEPKSQIQNKYFDKIKGKKERESKRVTNQDWRYNFKFYFQDSSFNKKYNHQRYQDNMKKLIRLAPTFDFSDEILRKSVNVKNLEFNYTLCIDLDETMIHCDIKGKRANPDKIIEVNYQGHKRKLHLFFRPFLNKFLEFASKKFNLILFTSAIKDYADLILKEIDPFGTLFKYKLYRDSCINFEPYFLYKDLRVISNMDTNKIILIDNNLINGFAQVNNTYLITSFYEDKKDIELLNLIDFLSGDGEDIMFKLQQKFRFKESN